MADAKPAPLTDIEAAVQEVRRAHRQLLAASDKLTAALRVVVSMQVAPRPVDKSERIE